MILKLIASLSVMECVHRNCFKQLQDDEEAETQVQSTAVNFEHCTQGAYPAAAPCTDAAAADTSLFTGHTIPLLQKLASYLQVLLPNHRILLEQVHHSAVKVDHRNNDRLLLSLTQHLSISFMLIMPQNSPTIFFCPIEVSKFLQCSIFKECISHIQQQFKPFATSI